jgi:hypothetical protein
VKKYLVCPGEVHSVNDGQVHFVGARTLMLLYQVRPEECVIHHPDTPMRSHPAHLIRLTPREDGQYPLVKRPTP